MATTASRKSVSIHDYPEHLNPFREDDNHNKISFRTIGRRLSRSNSINFKDIKNSWAFRSFMKKGKKYEPPPPSQQQENRTSQVSEDSPIVFRRAMQYSQASRNTVGSTDRYVYGGSVTPLPRSRFQERLRSTSQQEVSTLRGLHEEEETTVDPTPRMARSEVSGSRLSVESANPFEGPPVPPVRASRRKKKRAPLPPSEVADISMTSDTSELQTSADNSVLESTVTEEKIPGADLDVDDMNLNIELKIVEDEDVKDKEKIATDTNANEVTTNTAETIATLNKEEKDERMTPKSVPKEDIMKTVDSIETILETVSFPKIDIMKYRRNSSINEDDVRLRRGNLEDFHVLATKRSKSLTNDLDSTYVTYDINLNEKEPDTNGNDEPQKVVCKLYDDLSRKQSIDTISSTEKEFIEIDKVRREFETEINKLNAALEEDFSPTSPRLSVSEIKRKFDKGDTTPNPIPKPRRSNYSDSGSPVNGIFKCK